MLDATLSFHFRTNSFACSVGLKCTTPVLKLTIRQLASSRRSLSVSMQSLDINTSAYLYVPLLNNGRGSPHPHHVSVAQDRGESEIKQVLNKLGLHRAHLFKRFAPARS